MSIGLGRRNQKEEGFAHDVEHLISLTIKSLSLGAVIDVNIASQPLAMARERTSARKPGGLGRPRREQDDKNLQKQRGRRESKAKTQEKPGLVTNIMIQKGRSGGGPKEKQG